MGLYRGGGCVTKSEAEVRLCAWLAPREEGHDSATVRWRGRRVCLRKSDGVSQAVVSARWRV